MLQQKAAAVKASARPNPQEYRFCTCFAHFGAGWHIPCINELRPETQFSCIERQHPTMSTVNPNIVKAFRGAVTATVLTFAAAGTTLAWSVPVGTTEVSSCTQNGTLSNGSLFTLYTNIYQTGNLYTTQYDLRNINDEAGLTTMTANFNYAGTSGTKLFFGDAPNSGGIVYHDGAVGSSVKNNGSIDYNTHAPTMEAYTQNGQVIWQTLGTPLTAGQDAVSQLGFNGHDQYGSFGYLYVQTSAKPVQNTITVADKDGFFGKVTDCAGGPCGGPPPAAVPEPGSIASMGVGGLGVLGLLLRARKRGVKSA